MQAFIPLTSVRNPLVQNIRELASAKGRRRQQAFICDGEHMVLEALRACPQAVRAVLVEETARAKHAVWLAEYSNSGNLSIQFYSVPQHIMAAISQVPSSQGIAAVMSMSLPSLVNTEVAGYTDDAPLWYGELSGGAGLGNRVVLMENLQDPGNVGGILRTVDAAGFNGAVLTTGCADPFAAKTLRASMGSVFRVPMVCAEGDAGITTARAIQVLQTGGYTMVAADLDGEPFYSRVTLPGRVCLMVGNEGEGLSPEALSAATLRFRLPMRGGAESLNVAVAAAVMMYDIVNRG